MTKSIKEFRKKIKPEVQIAAREKAAGIPFNRIRWETLSA